MVKKRKIDYSKFEELIETREWRKCRLGEAQNGVVCSNLEVRAAWEAKRVSTEYYELLSGPNRGKVVLRPCSVMWYMADA